MKKQFQVMADLKDKWNADTGRNEVSDETQFAWKEILLWVIFNQNVFD